MTTAPTNPAHAEPWTTRRLLAWMTDAFARHNLDAPRLSAEILLAHVLNPGRPDAGSAQRLALYTDPDRPATPDELAALRGLAARALKHEPIQYLTRQAWFFGLPFHVDPRVLIPRPSTETLVERLLQDARRATVSPLGRASQPADGDSGPQPPHPSTHQPVNPSTPRPDRRPATELLIGDVCTGSGCIAIALLKHLPKARIIATDLSLDALEVARENARRHAVLDRLELLHGDLLAPLAERLPATDAAALDVLVSNPPYIPDHEWPAVEPNVKDHEPEHALRAGADGLQFIAPLLRDGPALLKPGGTLLIELAASTAPAVLALAQSHPRLTDATILKDLEGLDRALYARRA